MDEMPRIFLKNDESQIQEFHIVDVQSSKPDLVRDDTGPLQKSQMTQTKP